MFLEELFIQIGVVIVAAALLSFLAFRLRQPLIIAYILTGILIGPSALNLSTEPHFFKTLSDIGIAFLLFIVGLNLNWKHIKEVGPISLATGVGQVLFTTGAGYFIGLALGFESVTSLYVGLAFAFSSTIIIVKLLSDKEDLQRLYGRISVGFLIVQDLMAMLILLFLGALRGGGDLQTIITVALGQWILVILVLVGLSLWVLPRVSAYAARSQELLFLFGIAWCFGFASVLALLGFGIEIGALLAGIALAGTVWSQEISARIRPLRDFFLVIFFILLGTQLTLASLEELWVPALILSAFVLIGNPLIVVLIMRSLGYHPRTGFMAGTTVAQISEFSFIVLAAGIGIGHIGDEVLGLATIVGLVTIAVSSYLITYNETIYDKLSPLFKPLEPPTLSRYAGDPPRNAPSVMLFGYNRMGEVILPRIKKLKTSHLVVDFDPVVATKLKKRGVPHVYGDASDHEFLGSIQADQAKLLISTIPDEQISLSMLSYLKQRRYNGTVIVTVKTPEQAEHAYREGATFVIVPSVLGGERFAEFLKKERLDPDGWGKLAKTEGGSPKKNDVERRKKSDKEGRVDTPCFFYLGYFVVE